MGLEGGFKQCYGQRMLERVGYIVLECVIEEGTLTKKDLR